MPNRAHIPVLTRVIVARRQLQELGAGPVQVMGGVRLFPIPRGHKESMTRYLERLLDELRWKLTMGTEELELHHDPALVLRAKTIHTDGSVTYRPKETDHRYLRYMAKSKHLQQTVGRTPGAERTVTTKGSDIWLAKLFRKREKKSKRPKQRIPSRPFPKTRRSFGDGPR